MNSLPGRIRELIIDGADALYAVNTVVNEYVQIFSNSIVPMIQEKILDVKDLENDWGVIYRLMKSRAQIIVDRL